MTISWVKIWTLNCNFASKMSYGRNFFPKHAILACSNFWLCIYGTTTKCNKTSVIPQNTPPWVCCQTRVRFRLLTLRGSNDHSEVAYRLTHSRNETKLLVCSKLKGVYKVAHLDSNHDWNCSYLTELNRKKHQTNYYISCFIELIV